MTKNATNEVPETNSGPDYACGILRPKYQQSSVGPGALTRHLQNTRWLLKGPWSGRQGSWKVFSPRILGPEIFFWSMHSFYEKIDDGGETEKTGK